MKGPLLDHSKRVRAQHEAEGGENAPGLARGPVAHAAWKETCQKLGWSFTVLEAFGNHAQGEGLHARNRLASILAVAQNTGYKVLVDNQTVIDAGALAVLGVLPSGRTIVDTVRARLRGQL